LGYGQNDDARRYEEQRRQDQLRQEEARRWEQKRYEQQKADDDRRYYARKQETERQNRAYAEHKQEENADTDSRHREARKESDRAHQEATDAYHQNLRQQQDRTRSQEEERYLDEQRQRQSSSPSGGPAAGGDDGAFGSLIGLALFGLAVWAAWQGLQKFWLFTAQWSQYDIPLRWIGQYYRTILFDWPTGVLAHLSGGVFDSLGWILGGVSVVVLLVLIALVTSRMARRLFGLSLFVALTPAVLGGGWLLWIDLSPHSAESAKAWFKAQPFYTAQVNGAEMTTSVIALASWLGCPAEQTYPFPSAAVNALVRGKVLVPVPLKTQDSAKAGIQTTLYKPSSPAFSLAGQIAREIRLTAGANGHSLEVDFAGKPKPVAAAGTRDVQFVSYSPTNVEGATPVFSSGNSGYREIQRGQIVGYGNVYRQDKQGFTVRCAQ
jgi:hypothetical protein